MARRKLKSDLVATDIERVVRAERALAEPLTLEQRVIAEWLHGGVAFAAARTKLSAADAERIIARRCSLPDAEGSARSIARAVNVGGS